MTEHDPARTRYANALAALGHPLEHPADQYSRADLARRLHHVAEAVVISEEGEAGLTLVTRPDLTDASSRADELRTALWRAIRLHLAFEPLSTVASMEAGSEPHSHDSVSPESIARLWTMTAQQTSVLCQLLDALSAAQYLHALGGTTTIATTGFGGETR
ncbi:hypothetical protein [Streptomyces sp. G-5]|uniref:hypothetical protein n=1 Tax=Streptomyces sp. G-5 TaxID=2977231 RepID=UPI0021D216CF|nr:hypothetical protein [Streptomyces sp. G-5]MCU4750239.1 hypothetical protein [Streptomyces sp. G-5]